MRVWFLKQTNSIDTESSVGANTVVWSREGVIHRITPRRNDEVNDTWMSDSGRLLYKPVAADDRLESRESLDALISRAAEALADAAGAIAIVASGRSSVEEQFLTRKLAEVARAEVHLVAREGVGDGILISSDRNPNVRGALVTGLISGLPSARLDTLGRGIDSGVVKLVISMREDLSTAGISASQLAKVTTIHLGTHANPTSDAAHVVIPTLTVFEKAGTFVNQQFRLQKFAKAVAGKPGMFEDLEVLSRLIAAVGGGQLPSDVHGLWDVLASEIPVLAKATYRTLPEAGMLLDSTPWSGLQFPEGASLHFKPAVPGEEVKV